MSATESLRLSLDNANVRIKELETENSRLRDAHPQEAEDIDKDHEMQHLKELYAQALQDLQEKQKEVEKAKKMVQERQSQETRSMELNSQLEKEKNDNEQLRKQQSEQSQEWEQQRDSWELERFCAIEKERRKWEEREARLVSQLEEAECCNDILAEDRRVAETQPRDPICQSTTSQPSESIAGEVPLSQPPSTPRTGISRKEPNVVQSTSQPLSFPFHYRWKPL